MAKVINEDFSFYSKIKDKKDIAPILLKIDHNNLKKMLRPGTSKNIKYQLILGYLKHNPLLYLQMPISLINIGHIYGILSNKPETMLNDNKIEGYKILKNYLFKNSNCSNIKIWLDHKDFLKKTLKERYCNLIYNKILNIRIIKVNSPPAFYSNTQN